MIKSIKINDKETLKRLHFSEASFYNFNILFGGNGAGKTTLLNYLKDSIEHGSKDLVKSTKKKYHVHSYFNSKDNNRYNVPNPMGNSQEYTRLLSTRLHAHEISEGQSILYSFSEWLDYTLKAINKTGYHIILLDEIDSGLSCDHVNVIIHMVNDNLLSLDNVQVFISSNMYHWAYVAKDVFSMYDGNFIRIDSYEQYFRIQQDNQHTVGKKSDFNFF